MTTKEELRKICPEMTQLSWGKIQNNNTDSKFPNGMTAILKIDNYDILTETLDKIETLEDEDKKYFKIRWFRAQCSFMDEETFCVKGCAIRNTNPYDKHWDVEFWNDSNLRYDVKSTQFPNGLLNKYDYYVQNPEQLVRWF